MMFMLYNYSSINVDAFFRFEVKFRKSADVFVLKICSYVLPERIISSVSRIQLLSINLVSRS